MADGLPTGFLPRGSNCPLSPFRLHWVLHHPENGFKACAMRLTHHTFSMAEGLPIGFPPRGSKLFMPPPLGFTSELGHVARFAFKSRPRRSWSAPPCGPRPPSPHSPRWSTSPPTVAVPSSVRWPSHHTGTHPSPWGTNRRAFLFIYLLIIFLFFALFFVQIIWS